MSVQRFMKKTPRQGIDDLIHDQATWNERMHSLEIFTAEKMQNRSFRIDDILGEELSKETTKPSQKEQPQMSAVRRPILLPRVQPMIWDQCVNNCCSSPPNCVHVRDPRACYSPWYYNRNPHAFQGKGV